MYYGTRGYVDEMDVSRVAPVRYRVLDKNTTDFNQSGNTKPTMLLECDNALIKSDYAITYGTWENSTAREVLNGESFLTREGFSNEERGAIVASYKAAKNINDGQTLIMKHEPLRISTL